MSTAGRAPIGIDLPSSLDASRHARAFLRAQLLGMPSNTLADAELLLSELVSNAVRHGKPPIRVNIEFHAAMTRFCVHDAGDAFEVIAVQGVTRPSRTRRSGGRGLLITEAVAASWGIIADGPPAGKTVWFVLDD